MTPTVGSLFYAADINHPLRALRITPDRTDPECVYITTDWAEQPLYLALADITTAEPG